MDEKTKAVISKEINSISKQFILIAILSACTILLTYVSFPDKLPSILMLFLCFFLFNLGVSMGIILLAKKIEKET